MKENPIGIFDSGVGGLTILSEVQKILPQENTIFVADQLFVPYGQRTQVELIARVSKIMEFFKKRNVKAAVMACNTATVYTISEMRQKFEFPIIGTVPVVKTLAKITKTGKTVVFSTPATAKSKYLGNLIQEFAPNIEVKRIGGSNLEELIENGNLNSPEIEKVLQSTLPDLVKNEVDAIALGCTHYPFLKKRIQEIVGEKVHVVDSGGAVARRLRQVLMNEKFLSLQKEKDLYYTTGDILKFEKVSSELLRKKIKAQHLSL
jgi:glutamate racemase